MFLQDVRAFSHPRNWNIEETESKTGMSTSRALVRTDRDFAITWLAAPGLDSSSILTAHVLK